MKERKDDKYKKEQEEILIKIIRKIGISKDKRRFNREELERETIKDYINEMLDEIKRYYKMSNWRSIKTWKEVELNLITNILKYNGIDTIKVDRKRKEGDKYKHYREYIFDIKDEILEKI
jgi:hypothetical protein